jgi:hypothetical protein
MQKAHTTGMALVGVWVFELAEAYCDLLRSEGVSGNRVQGHYGKLCFLRVYISSIFFELATTKRTASAQRNANPATDTCCGATTRERSCAADSDRMERLDAS